MSKPCDSCCDCNGSCCAVFFFPSSPAKIDENIERDGAYNGNDGRMVSNMLIPLTHDEALARASHFEVGEAHRKQIERHPDSNFYTCRHWDEETRLCGVYDHRPDLCSKYPYGNACVGCGGVSGEPMPRGGILATLGRD